MSALSHPQRLCDKSKGTLSERCFKKRIDVTNEVDARKLSWLLPNLRFPGRLFCLLCLLLHKVKKLQFLLQYSW